MAEQLPKGYRMEELLRRYFLKSGHFTVRGVPFVYRGLEITDIDVWAYDRPSPVSRQRIVVDCKNRSTPKAIERIFWARGLQHVLGVEQAVVATTEKRDEIVLFGREHGVVIIDGKFLDRLGKSAEHFEQRLTEEQFTSLLSSYHPTRDGGDWKARVRAAKQPLVSDLSYNAVNGWINDAHFFAEQMLTVSTHSEVACRVLYLMLAFVGVGIDFALRDLAFADATTRVATVNEGLRVGSQGAMNTKHVLGAAIGLIEHYAPENKALAVKVRERLNKDLDNLPTKMLAEYLCKQPVSQELLMIAREFEAAAYDVSFVAPHRLSAITKSFLALFLDFWNMDRSRFLRDVSQDSDMASLSTSMKQSSSASKVTDRAEDQAELPGMK